MNQEQWIILAAVLCPIGFLAMVFIVAFITNTSRTKEDMVIFLALMFVGVVIIMAISGMVSKSHADELTLTVGQVINIGQTVANIDQKPTGTIDRNGNPITALSGARFSGTTLMTFSRIVDMSRDVLKRYQDAVAKLEADGDTNLVADRQKMFDAPAGVTLPHVKESDLCLDGPPAQKECAVKNDLSVGSLSVLLPIIEQVQR